MARSTRYSNNVLGGTNTYHRFFQIANLVIVDPNPINLNFKVEIFDATNPKTNLSLPPHRIVILVIGLKELMVTLAGYPTTSWQWEVDELNITRWLTWFKVIESGAFAITEQVGLRQSGGWTSCRNWKKVVACRIFQGKSLFIPIFRQAIM